MIIGSPQRCNETWDGLMSVDSKLSNGMIDRYMVPREQVIRSSFSATCLVFHYTTTLAGLSRNSTRLRTEYQRLSSPLKKKYRRNPFNTFLVPSIAKEETPIPVPVVLAIETEKKFDPDGDRTHNLCLS